MNQVAPALNEVEQLIHDTVVQADIDFVRGIEGDHYVKRIYEALKAKGWLKDGM